MRKFILGGVLLVFLGSAVFATGINVYFNDDSVRDKDNNPLSAANYHNYKVRLEFYHNVDPADPRVSTSRLADAVVQPLYSNVGGQHKYQLAELNGGALYVRVWKDSPSGDRRGNYYGVASHAVASGATPPVDWTITNIKTDHKADVPYKPTIGSISESLQRVGEALQLRLVIPISYDSSPAGGDGIRDAQSFSLAITYPDATTDTKSGSSITLSDTPAGNYKFRPTATNWYGSTVGDEVPYTTLGMAVGGSTFVFDLKKSEADKLVVNSIATPSKTLTDGSVAVASELAGYINAKAGKTIVTAIGRWDAAAAQAVGVTFGTEGNIASGADFEIVPGIGYQVYTTEDISITLSGQ